MICGSCGHEARTYKIDEVDHHECDHCRRRLVEREDPLTQRPVSSWNRLGGFCFGCLAPVWRTIRHPTTGENKILWPMPTAKFLVIQCGTDEIQGVPICPSCCPDPGAPASKALRDQHPSAGNVLRIEGPVPRYKGWFSNSYEVWLAAWLSDHFRLDEPERDRLIALWREDRALIFSARKEAEHGSGSSGSATPI